MPRDNGSNRQLRGHIAHIAARLMAVDGIDDLALAKRKAARQAGAPDTRSLPTNEEVEEALRAYHQLYLPDEQQARLRHLRTRAVEMMGTLEQFNPFLSGSVLRGNAGKYTEIDLLLFTDSAKDVEMFLLNRQIPFRSGDRKVWVGEEQRGVPNFSISTPDANFDVTVFSPRDLRLSLRSTAEGRPYERARIESVIDLLADGSTTLFNAAG
jgi:hypothetical protein